MTPEEYRAEVMAFEEMREAAEDKLRQSLEGALHSAARRVFDEHPDIYAIEWEQFTPYFNDGDECVFGLNDIWFVHTDDAKPYDDCDYSYLEDLPNSRGSGDFENASSPRLFDEVLRGFEEAARYAFGDHVRVVVKRGVDGSPEFETVEYTEHY